MNRNLIIEDESGSTVRAPVNGRQRLIEAAIRLAAQHGGIGAVGMRELAREAGLNPNTFYRHFDSIDDLGVAALETVMPPLRDGLRELRQGSLSFAESTHATIAFFFDFVAAHPDAIMLAARELYGASPRLRDSLRRSIADLTNDLVEAVERNGWASSASADNVREISDTIIKQFFALGLDLAQQPELQKQIVVRAERFVLVTFTGGYFVDTFGLTTDIAFEAVRSGTLASSVGNKT